MNRRFTLSIALVISLFCSPVWAQYFSAGDYEKALWMTTRFYGGQRSGEHNWLLHNHLPSGVPTQYRGTAFINDNDNGYDLSGGWHDCGDHVKFGQTEFYSAYMLLKGFAEFPQGYDDYYDYEYTGYKTSGKWHWEDNSHSPNGIPDVLDEVKHATDFFIKCARNSSTFYYQVGQGGPDHQKWVTAVMMQTLPKSDGGQPREVYKNPNDASMASFCGATLALMSRMYRKYDPAYADLCLQHARYAYDYAKAHPGVAGTGDGGFYSANDNWKDDYATMCAELYWATGTESYKTEALSFSISASAGQAEIYGKSDWVDYSNNGEIAIYNLALLGKANATTVYNQCINNILAKTQADGQFSGGNVSWGPMRYNANTAFHVALWQKLNGTDNTVHQFIYDNIDYILGKNSANQSFVVGFGSKSPKFPHHRNVFLRDDNPSDNIKRGLAIPEKNKQFGLMVGGTRNPGSYSDDLVNYTHTEGGIDYNACLVGAIAYIRSKLSPVDTNKFGNVAPELGPDVSICGTTGIELDSKIPTDGVKTFTWLKDDNVLFAASNSRNKITVTSAGKYTCILDSLGEWSTQASINVLGVLPDVDLGNDIELCSPSSATLEADIAGQGITFEWKRNGEIISGATGNSYTVYKGGTYALTISASGCPSKTDEVTVSADRLVNVAHAVLCEPGTATLTVLDNGGPYEWYGSSGSSTVLATGNAYKPTVSSSSVFYVRDGGSISVTAGPSISGHTLSSPSNQGTVGIAFTAQKAFNITGLTVMPFIYSCDPNDQVIVTFTLTKNGSPAGTYSTQQVACQGAQTNAPFTPYVLVFEEPVVVSEPGEYILQPSGGNQLAWFESGANYAQYGVEGIITITNDTRTDRPSSFPAIFDMQIQSGSGCERTPVVVSIDSGDPDCSPVTSIWDTPVNSYKLVVYPNPSSGDFHFRYNNTNTTDNVRIYNELGILIDEFSPAKVSSFGSQLPSGLYHLIYYQNEQIIERANIVKQ